jgi:hypothetical protein
MNDAVSSELDQRLRGGLRFVDEHSITRLQDGSLTFRAKAGLSNIQFALLFQKVQNLGGSYCNTTGSFHIEPDETVADTGQRMESHPGVSTVSGDTAGAVDNLSLFERIESQLRVSGSDTLESVAKKLGVGRATVAKAKKIIVAAPEEVKGDCRQGKRTINAAYILVQEAGN